jgi:outer membrane receptor protein involved in Fe transport
MAYGETVGRPTFRELSPIFQQEYLGGPIFVGNPALELSAVRNYDLRADWTPTESTLLSASWFQKDIQNPIEYVEKLAQYTFTTAVNFPRGTMSGIELEARQGLGDLWEPLQGITIGANSTWIDAKVRLPDDEILAFQQLHGELPRSIRDMTNTPDYLYNLFATYDVPYVGTGLGLFYTVTGDTLIQGTGPSGDFFVPATYQTRYETLNVTLSQPLGSGIRLMLSGRNLTNALRRQVYRSEYQDDDVTRRSFTEGVDWSLMIGGEITF